MSATLADGMTSVGLPFGCTGTRIGTGLRIAAAGEGTRVGVGSAVGKRAGVGVAAPATTTVGDAGPACVLAVGMGGKRGWPERVSHADNSEVTLKLPSASDERRMSRRRLN